MDDTLTITFFLAGGKTPQGNRLTLTFGGSLWLEEKQISFDPGKEDMGVGLLLNDPLVVAVDVAWVDDYDDTKEPVLMATGLYFSRDPQADAMLDGKAAEFRYRRVNAPYYESGIQIVEWIVQYMQENVYNQDVDADNRPDGIINSQNEPTS
ncbi:MAG: hypothetical protein KF726_20745 [Anaerolineae bacterium]|nr:hypothetical protein [Anaerolineae bacterium]